VNIGIVIGLEEGLLVPVIPDVPSLSISRIAELSAQIKEKATEGRLGSNDLTGGTFTISNLGMFGISSFIAVINPPESSILALGGIEKKYLIKNEGQISIRPLMTATVSADHRVVDGITTAKFLVALQDVLNQIQE
jgi:pyruvate dehydrogenase E2 component (dihydrolipoamide acetyltransferase)